MRATISGVTGTFTAGVGADDSFDLTQPVEGFFALQVDDLDLGNRILTFAVGKFLGRDVSGRLGHIAPPPEGGDEYAMQLFLTIRGKEHELWGHGHVDPPDGDRAVLHGGLTAHPADIGLRVPGFLVPTTEMTFALVLELVP